MIEARWQLGAEFEMLGSEFLRDLLQGFQMRRRITVPKRMVGDEVEAALEEGPQ